MTFHPDFALFYAYVLALFAALVLWVLKNVASAIGNTIAEQRQQPHVNAPAQARSAVQRAHTQAKRLPRVRVHFTR